MEYHKNRIGVFKWIMYMYKRHHQWQNIVKNFILEIETFP